MVMELCGKLRLPNKVYFDDVCGFTVTAKCWSNFLDLVSYLDLPK